MDSGVGIGDDLLLNYGMDWTLLNLLNLVINESVNYAIGPHNGQVHQILQLGDFNSDDR